jgi:hypothetical protein
MSDDDPLLKKARMAQEKARRSSNVETPRSFIEEQADKVNRKITFWRRFFKTSGEIWKTYFKPVARILNPLARAYWRACRAIFTKVSFTRAGEYSKKRAAAAVVGLTLFTVVAGYQTIVSVIPFTTKMVFDAIAIEAFSYQETLLFGKPDILDVEENLWGVSACRKYPCEGQTDSIEYRIRDSNWLDVKRLFTKFEPHDPGELKGAFNSEENACNVTVYSKRVKFPFVPISWGFYPLIIDATCIAVNGDNWEEALARMRARREK